MGYIENCAVLTQDIAIVTMVVKEVRCIKVVWMGV